MKKFATLILCLAASYTHADFWTQKADLPGDDRGAAAGFSINGKGYIGTGIKFASANPFHDDFWEYDTLTNNWTQKANYGGIGRSGATGFSVLGKGYIACGHDGNSVQQDVWEYDPGNNSWTQKASLTGPGRNYTCSFVIDSLAYLGTGYDASTSNYQDFWEFNPVANIWTQKSNIGTSTRSSALAFSVETKGYIGAGYNGNYLDDLWEYDPALNSWTQKASIPGSGRSDGVAFAIGEYGYVLTGQTSLATSKDVQQYDPQTNSWLQKTSLIGPARSNAVAFSIGEKGYIGTGYDPSFITLNDFWEYTPDSSVTGTAEVHEISSATNLKIFPNPSNGIFHIQYEAGKLMHAKIIFTDMNGKVVVEHLIRSSNGNEIISSDQFVGGIYFYEIVMDEKIKQAGKILIMK